MQQGTYREIYLDNAATTRASAEAAAEVARCLTESYGNPSSLHRKGIEADGIIAESAAALAALIGASPDEILFTSGGTEANNMAIFGAIASRRPLSNRVVISSIEHPSVHNVGLELRRRGFDVVLAPVGCDGVLDLDRFREAVWPGAALVSVMHVNNETGAIQPVDRVAAILRELPEKPLLHVDSVQSLGHIPVRPANLGVDLASFSAHKVHGPKGCGALWIRKGIRLDPIVFGGGQQRSLRSGTENVPGIAGFGAACRRIASSPGSARETLVLLRDMYLKRLGGLPGLVVIGPRYAGTEPGLAAPHILNVSFRGLKGEVLVRALGALGVYVSTGAACSSRKKGPSRVLTAMGVPQAVAEGSIRLSFGMFNTADEVDPAIAAIEATVARLRGIRG